MIGAEEVVYVVGDPAAAETTGLGEHPFAIEVAADAMRVEADIACDP